LKAILLKEINTFFSSLIGYVAIIVFLTVMGLFLWVFPDTNVLDFGFSSLDGLFTMAPWVLMFLIPAITMRSFAEESDTGTIEILATRPVSDWQIIFGKFLASLSLVIIALIPTLIYYLSVYLLGNPVGNIDTGATNGSYLGLIFMSAVFISIGLWASSLTKNQIVAFIIAVFLCFFLFMAFDYLSRLNIFYAKLDHFIEQLGIYAHYNSISRGLIDSRDIIYFLSAIAFFLYLTKITLGSRKW